ncbi:cryptochrome/photolyase family protein [Frigidibacter sp. MR17.24]|uniref:cryptochrome/photolyase family protein n=1 Tax=Frigidibacter sp. MR17.24 TaxID=3127345 RepID=UPI0030130212
MTDSASPDAPLILWLRREFRLSDHPALSAAVATGRPVIPVFVLDELVEDWGAAPKWRLGEAIAAFDAALRAKDSRLVLRRGPALTVLRALARETGAAAVAWTRAYDPATRNRDATVKAALKDDGLEVTSHPGHTLAEPWEIETGQGGFYKVYTPFWKALRARGVPEPDRAPAKIPAPAGWPASDSLADWRLGAAMRRGAAVVAAHAHPGEARARDRLHRFLSDKVAQYADDRDRIDLPATSGLSENLTWGEIGPRTVWHAGLRALEDGGRGAETFLKELAWRDFAWHLCYHAPDLATTNFREDWNGFGWRRDNREAEAWRRGLTGEPLVDAAMREMYVTGTMHNRARMVVASYLTKHLLTDWRVGLRWFEDCLIDWDPASNALGWQWVAGCGPDAAPYFRVFNPETQAEKFDPDRRYRDAWIAEGRARPAATALSYFEACPVSWGLAPDEAYPDRIVGLKEGRERALAAYAEK